jgi:hypothetical protein
MVSSGSFDACAVPGDLFFRRQRQVIDQSRILCCERPGGAKFTGARKNNFRFVALVSGFESATEVKQNRRVIGRQPRGIAQSC